MGIRNYDNMVNQDVILEDQISNKCKIFGIFDGHGEYGKIIAQTAKNIFQSKDYFIKIYFKNIAKISKIKIPCYRFKQLSKKF